MVVENHWLTETQFIDAVAVAMITPGPVVITVGFIGYLIGGFQVPRWPARYISSLLFIHCYTRTLFQKIAKNKPVKAFVDGITAAVMGALMGSVFVISLRTIKDVPTFLIALFTLLALLYVKKLKEPLIILVAAALGIILKLII